MMLAASPFPPSFSPSNADDQRYAPTTSLNEFNERLGPAVEFIAGSSSGAFAVPEGRYQPINSTPKVSQHKFAKSSNAAPSPLSPSKTADQPARPPALYSNEVDIAWPQANFNVGSGLFNNGNTCFLNSAVQCLIHTPPLLRILVTHSTEKCTTIGFCMICSLHKVAIQAHTNRSAFSPSAITNKLQVIAKHFRRGRQEDSHEFLRYAIDALQKSCLGGGNISKIDPKIAETTWVHKIFGGRLRSRVTCRSCKYNSDTFDNILDLSLDIHNIPTLKDALRKFVAKDYLKGADKYKCEKCKKHVDAEKCFTLDAAPAVLTVHLKRFSPLGRKIGHPVQYDDTLVLQPYMSEGKFGPTYSLYGVICHAGGGPNSGHYYAFVKSKDGRWYEMNDESVTPIGGPPSRKTAYILFYIRSKGQRLESAVASQSLKSLAPLQNGLISGMKRKAPHDEAGDEDTGTSISKPFIGPILPSSPITLSGKPKPVSSVLDPQAELVKKKIENAGKPATMTIDNSLVDYGSDSDGELEKESTIPPKHVLSSPIPLKHVPSSPIPPSSQASLPASSSPVSPVTFYGTSSTTNQAKRWKNNLGSKSHGYNPYGSLGKQATYGGRQRKKSRGI